MRIRSAAVAAVALLTLTPAATAVAGSHPTPERGLLLTVSHADSTWIRGVGLQCPPRSGGRHPEARAACNALTWARGDFDALPGDPHVCTKQYDPVTATADGTWHGRTVHWAKTFGNACMLDAETGPVFRF
ncbi:SSI family serine proteinase inhibitor [Streptomyces sp. NPDC048442]|uniref:SSI family serine proteinase inhibitor n=1 Tax=Streptomyces sp. NPDC048442 TaxID=3154823 RepID=UPI003421308F